jgi:hypothetical protein
LGVAKVAGLGLGTGLIGAGAIRSTGALIGGGALGYGTGGLIAGVRPVGLGLANVGLANVGLANVGIAASAAPVAVNAAVTTLKRTVDYRPVPYTGEPIIPQVVDVPPSEQPVQLNFQSKSSPLIVSQQHIPGINFVFYWFSILILTQFV